MNIEHSDNFISGYMISRPTCIIYVFILSKLPIDIEDIPMW